MPRLVTGMKLIARSEMKRVPSVFGHVAGRCPCAARVLDFGRVREVSSTPRVLARNEATRMKLAPTVLGCRHLRTH